MNTINRGEILESRFGDVKKIEGFQSWRSISLAKVTTEDQRGRSWRITLSRLNRNDQFAPNLFPLFDVQDFSYTFGDIRSASPAAGTVPPRRNNPVLGSNFPANNADCDPPFVQVAWGMSVGATNRMVAHWPMQGASLVVEGSYVEVFAGESLLTPGDPQITIQELPTFAASITPVDGLPSEAAGELSLQQSVLMKNFVGQPIAGLPTNPAGLTPGGSMGFGDEAIPCSAVFNTAPFHGWTARITLLNPFAPATVRMVMSTDPTPVFTLTDDLASRVVTVTYAVTAGGVGAKTVAQLEALINTSELVQISAADIPHAAEFVFPGFTANFTTFVPDGQGVRAGLVAGGSQGGAVYVPDFARRVMITGATIDPRFAGIEYRVPTDGPQPMQIVWYNDFGQVVWTEFQGLTTAPSTGSQEGPTEPTIWRAVPSQATMLAVYSQVPDLNAFFHWRLAP